MSDTQQSNRSSGLGLAMRMGTEMVAATLIGLAIGHWLDRWLDTGPWMTVVFLLLGISSGFLNVYRAVNPEQDPRNRLKKPPTE